MPKANTLKQFLHATDSLNSLISEIEIARTFQSLCWEVKHGYYYNDLKENKVREIDVKAVQHWERKVKEDIQSLTINVVLESKSLKSTNIIIAPYHPYGAEKDPRISYWIGQESSEEHGLLQAEMVKYGIPGKLIPQLNKEFEKKAFPDESAKISGLNVNPNLAIFQSTAFREITSTREKDLDSSVLWRAIQGVTSAVESCYTEAKEGARELITMAIRFGDKANQPRYSESIISAFDRSASYVEIWHPVVVLDANLWVLSKKKLIKADWFRFGPFKSIDSNFLWSDVVSRKYLPKYVEAISEHYRDECSKAGASIRQYRF